jgi:glycosyltransferase involved in cell wall biosynthesis
VLLITGHVPASRRGAYLALAERVPLELALYGGPHQHGAPPLPPPQLLRVRELRQIDVGAAIRSGDYSAVIAGTGGRLALPLAWRAARQRELPFIFWAALWHTPRTPAHLAARPLMRHIYRNAAAVVTYGPHVSRYVAAQGARRIFIAPQAVDNEFWSAPTPVQRGERFEVLFAGRANRAKGVQVLLEAWRQSALEPGTARLTLVGAAHAEAPGVTSAGMADAEALRNFYARSSVLVIPSIRTRRFVEPWGLVVNEAMNQQCAVIASDAVGAAAGGLVRHEHNGLIVPAGDPRTLASSLQLLASDRARCATLGRTGSQDVSGYTYDAWADGFVEALGAVSGRSNTGSVGL